MCLYPKRMVNKKYTATEKNGGCVPLPPVIGKDQNEWDVYDERILYVEIPCGNCIECRKAKAREWQVRLAEELKSWEKAYFMTLTFSPEALATILKKYNIKECNAAAGYALRHMLERWRKTHKKSLKHWFVTELGHEGTERIHMHGIIFTNEELKFGEKDDHQMCKWNYWKYGHIYVGEYCSLKTINYIVKYINKIDNDHKGFKGQILASPGIGREFLERQKHNPERYKYKPRNTLDYYRLNNGSKIKLPKYYANHLRNEEERELIWREFLDKEKETIAGNTYSTRTTPGTTIENITNKARDVSNFLGYGDDSNEWRKREYNITRRMIEKQQKENDPKEKMRKLEKNFKKTEKFLAQFENL